MVTLTSTLDPWRAHIARGVLEEHGIPAFVRHEAAALYGPLACGGFDLMVAEEDMVQAGEVLSMLPAAAAVPDGNAAEQLEVHPLVKALGAAMLCGAEIFLVISLLLALPRLFHIVLSNRFGAALKPLGQYFYELPSYLVLWILIGAVTGLGVGLPGWLVGDFRRRKGTAGRVFVGLVVVFMLVHDLLPYVLSLGVILGL